MARKSSRSADLTSQPSASEAELELCFANVELRLAYQQLRTTITARRGLFLLTGPPHIGKTVLLRHLGRELADAGVRVISSYRAGLRFDDLALVVLRELGAPADPDDRKSPVARVRDAIAAYGRPQGGTVLFIDDAQQLGSDVLRNIAAALTSADGSPAGLSLVLAGRPALAERLCAPVLAPLAQFLIVSCQLGSWRDREIRELISRRTGHGRCFPGLAFSSVAIDAMARCSEGNPGRAVRLADYVSRKAAVSGPETVGPEFVEEAAAELNLGGKRFPDRRARENSSRFVPAVLGGALALSISVVFAILAGSIDTAAVRPISDRRVEAPAAASRPDLGGANEEAGSSGPSSFAASVSGASGTLEPNPVEAPPGASEPLRENKLDETAENRLADTAAGPVGKLESAPIQLSPDAVAILMKRGAEMMVSGDIAAARLLFERAAAAGNAKAATAAGQAFDPMILNGIPTRGVLPAPEQAAKWYSRAREAGDADAEEFLSRLQEKYPAVK